MSTLSSNGSGPGAQARVVALTALADEAPEADELADFLADPEPVVRRAAVDVLTESAPPGAGAALAGLLLDPDPGVRAAVTEGLRELREVLEPDEAFATELARAISSDDPDVRTTVVRLWREHRLGKVSWFAEAAADPGVDVRCEAVAGLVSLDALAELAHLVADAEPLVRLAVARGVATVVMTLAGQATGARPRPSDAVAVEEPVATVGGTDLVTHSDAGSQFTSTGVAREVLQRLAGDDDIRVRAAATEGLGEVAVDDAGLRLLLAGMLEPEWEVRRAAATALRSGPREAAVPVLVEASRDANSDVRRAAVQSLARWRDDHPAAREALEAATADPDADVRGHARLGLG